MKSWQVLHIEICSILLPIYPLMLLRPASENNLNHTDYHNVDEDVPTSSEQGGFLTSETGAGIAYRYINFSSDTTSTGVASYV